VILPACNTEAMNLHLLEIAKTVTPGDAHAVLLVDQAGLALINASRLPLQARLQTIGACGSSNGKEHSEVRPCSASKRPPFTE
jgi:hypothetical protein